MVIPARNEEKLLGRCLESIAPFLSAGDPVLVVDDASVDATPAVARAAGVAVALAKGKGRGFAVATGVAALAPAVETLLILHADMVVPAAARPAIVAALDADPRALGGALGHRIDDSRGRFRWVEAGNRFRGGLLRLPYGDQAQFFRTSALGAIGGFPRQARLEDLELALRLRKSGVVLYLGMPVTIPARHWSGGVLRAWLRNAAVLLRYRLGERVKKNS